MCFQKPFVSVSPFHLIFRGWERKHYFAVQLSLISNLQSLPQPLTYCRDGRYVPAHLKIHLNLHHYCYQNSARLGSLSGRA